MDRLVLSVLLVSSVESYSSRVCENNQQCKDPTRVCVSGQCGCRAGYVDWKWECHPVVGLGENCITSAQCRTSPSQLCNPISHKCSCQRGFSPVVSSDYGLECEEVSTKDDDGSLHSSGYITQILWSPETLNLSSVTRPLSPKTEPQAPPVVSVSWLLSFLLVLGGLAGGILSLLYLKTLQEKRASQQRVKSLLRVVAEQSEMRPSLTSLTSFTTSLDVEDLYSSYCTPRDSRDQPSDGFPQKEKKIEMDGNIRELQLPPSYDELLK